MKQILKAFIRLRGSAAARRFHAVAARPEVAQQNFLLKLLRRNARTLFGQDHGFSSIRTEADFRRQVPIRDFEGFRPYVNRIVAGEKAVLTQADPCMLTTTSGTTGEPKYIPVTQESLKDGSRLMLQWLYRVLQDHPAFFDRAGVSLVSPAIEGYTPSGLPIGSGSGMAYKRLPAMVRSSHAIPYAVSEIHDYDRRYFVIARLALGTRVSYIGTPNPSTLIRLAETGKKHQESLIRAVHDGTLGIDLPDQPGVSDQIAARIKPNPERARFLHRVVEQAGFLRAADCWPDLTLLACWLGGSVGTQARKLSAHYGDVPLRDLGYKASEGNFTLPFEDHTSSGILAVQTNYYEFIPEDALDTQSPVLPSHELELGKRYSILLTTAAGLYRYDINDIVEVTGFHRKTPLLAFIRKGHDMTSITGEKMHVNHILLALDQVRRRYNLAIVEQFRIVPDFEAWCYDIYVELNTDVSHDLLRDEVIPALDQALGQVNVEYAQKRASGRLDLPRLHLMRPGWAERQSVATGKRDAQYKWRILCSERRLEDTQAILHTIKGGNDQLLNQEAKP
jgi:hypothetical protein